MLRVTSATTIIALIVVSLVCPNTLTGEPHEPVALHESTDSTHTIHLIGLDPLTLADCNRNGINDFIEAADSTKLIVTDHFRGNLYQRRVLLRPLVTINDQLPLPRGIAVDQEANLAYVGIAGGIARVALESGEMELIQSNLPGPDGLVLDEDGQDLLFIDGGSDIVGRIHLPTGEFEVLHALPYPESHANDLALDSSNSTLILSQNSPGQPQLSLIDLNDPDFEPQPLPVAVEGRANGVAVDPLTGDIFLATAGDEGRIWRIDPTSDYSAELLIDGLGTPSKLLVSRGRRLFWTDGAFGTINTANLPDVSCMKVVASAIDYPWGLALIERDIDINLDGVPDECQVVPTCP
jgi:DNA-binding beta-propeller fold protein YncE